MSWRSKNEDRLSCLPDEILSHILSLMPTKFAVRTSILSKRLRYSWTLITNLDFTHYYPRHHEKCFSKIVDWVLKHCKTSELKSFRLGIMPTSVQKSEVSKWINEAIRLKVCELDIEVRQTDLPLGLFTCKTLTKLSLVVGFDIHNVPPSVTLPALKTLDLRVCSYKPSVNLFRFIHGCPVLESLSLHIILHDIKGYNINIPTLKRLELKTKVSYFNKVVLNVANLEYLCVGGCICPYFVMEDLSSLPKFPNFKHLNGSSISSWLLLIKILESSSELEHLSFEELGDFGWIESQAVPTCVLTNLKTIKITKFKRRECNIRFLGYILGNAEVLEQLTIICGSLSKNNEMEMCAHFLKFPRASIYCEIRFLKNGF